MTFREYFKKCIANMNAKKLEVKPILAKPVVKKKPFTLPRGVIQSMCMAGSPVPFMPASVVGIEEEKVASKTIKQNPVR